VALDPIAQTSCPVPLAFRALRGDTVDIRLRLIDASTGRPIVLTGWSGVANVYASQVGGQVSHTMTVAVDQSAANNPTTGMVTITLAPNETVGWIEWGYWGLILSDGTTSKTIVAGPWELAGTSVGASLFTCAGLSGVGTGVCGSTSFELAGADCGVLGQGYTAILLPHPQGSCSCGSGC